MSELSPRDAEDLERMYQQRDAIPHDVRTAWMRGALKGSNDGMELRGYQLEAWVDGVLAQLHQQRRLHDVEWCERFFELLVRDGGSPVEVAMLLAGLG